MDSVISALRNGRLKKRKRIFIGMQSAPRRLVNVISQSHDKKKHRLDRGFENKLTSAKFRYPQYISRYRAHTARSPVSLRLDQSSSRLPSVTGPQQFATYTAFRSLGYNLLSLTSVTSHSIPHPEPPRARLSPIISPSYEARMYEDAVVVMLLLSRDTTPEI